MRRESIGPRGWPPDGPGGRAPAEALRLLVVLWASLPAVSPLLVKGIPATHDGLGHLFSLLDFDLTFRAGTLFPRLAPHLALDFGYASFTFYSPASIYLGEAFRLFGLGYIASLKACFALAILASGLGAYLLARELYGWRGALLAAVVYVYLPYHLLDVYARGDIAEALALALTPFVLWSFWRLARAPDSGRVVAAGVALGLLVTTHNLSAAIVAPVLLGFVLVGIDRRRPGPALGAIALAGLLALALSAVYWLPMLGEIGSIDTRTLTTAEFDYHHNFIPLARLVQQGWLYEYTYQPGTEASFNFGRAQVALLVGATLWVALARPRRWKLLLGGAAGIAVLAWLEQPGATFVWDHVPPARFLQFPYRLSADVTLLGCLLIGSLAGAPARSAGRRTLRLAGPLLGLLALGVLLRTSLGQLPSAHLDLDEERISLPMLWRLEVDRGLIEANTGPDYLPRTVRGDFFADAGHPMPQATPAPAPRLTALASAPLDLTARVEASRPTFATFDRLAYPAWRATIDGMPAPIEPTGPLGLIRVPIPAGTHTLRLAAAGTIFDALGLALSGLGLLAAGVVAGRGLGPAWPRAALAAGAIALVGGVGVARQILPAQPLAAGVDFARDGTPAIRLVGSRLNRVNRTPDGAVDLTLTWEALTTPLANCTVLVRVLDPAGRVVMARDKVPLFGLRPCDTWQAGEIIHDEEQVRLPAGVAPGDYRLAVGLAVGGRPLSPVDPAPVSWADPGSPAGARATGVLLGGFPLGAAPPTPRPRVARPGSANFVGRIALEGERVAALDPDGRPVATPADPRFVARAAPGDIVQVDLFWRSLADVSTDYSVFTHLVDDSNHLVAQDDAWPDRFSFPTSVWSPGDARHDQYFLTLDPAVKPGVYTLVAGLYERPSLRRLLLVGAGVGQDRAVLGTVKVSSPDRTFGDPVPLVRRDDVLGGQIALVGARVGAPKGGPLAVDLAWRPVAVPHADYTTFVHVLGPHGRLVAQKDGPPLGGAYPTSAWDAGDTIYGHVDVPLPAGLAAGRYQVVVGLYQLQDGARLATPHGQGQVQVGAFSA